MNNHPNRNPHPAAKFVDVLDELKAATGVHTRVLWETIGPKNTGIAYHGGVCMFTPMGMPCGVVYIQVYKSANGFEIFLNAPGSTKAEGFEWIKRAVTAPALHLEDA